MPWGKRVTFQVFFSQVILTDRYLVTAYYVLFIRLNALGQTSYYPRFIFTIHLNLLWGKRVTSSIQGYFSQVILHVLLKTAHLGILL
jgi:hypothetical protein